MKWSNIIIYSSLAAYGLFNLFKPAPVGESGVLFSSNFILLSFLVIQLTNQYNDHLARWSWSQLVPIMLTTALVSLNIRSMRMAIFLFVIVIVQSICILAILGLLDRKTRKGSFLFLIFLVLTSAGMMFFQPESNFCPVGFPTSLILVSNSIVLALSLPIVYWGLIYLMIKGGLFLKSRVTKLLLTVSLFISSCALVGENISPVLNWNEMDAKIRPQKEVCDSLSQLTELPVLMSMPNVLILFGLSEMKCKYQFSEIAGFGADQWK